MQFFQKKVSVVLIGFTLFWAQLQAQQPLAYWQFEQDTWHKPTIGSLEFQPKLYEANILASSGKVGRFIRLAEANRGVLMTRVEIEDVFTIELLFRLPTSGYHDNFRICEVRGNSVDLNTKRLLFRTRQNQGGEVIQDLLAVPLIGNNQSSFSYYASGNWIHMVAQYNSTTGEKRIWIDGVSPETFSKQVPTEGSLCVESPCKLLFSISANPKQNLDFIGDIDEIAVYDQWLSEDLIRQHANQAHAGDHYTFQKDRKLVVSAPTMEAQTEMTAEAAQVDLEYVIGHPTPSLSAIDQLRTFPLPRYKEGHNLLPLYNWLNINQIADKNQKGMFKPETVILATQFQEEMAKNWHYYLTIQNTKQAVNSKLLDENQQLGALIKLANQHPEWPLAMTSYWRQLIPKDIGAPSKRAFIVNWSQLPKEDILTDAHGNHINRSGKKIKNGQISMAAHTDAFLEDGKTQAFYFRELLDRLTRPVNMVAENGEVPPYPYTQKALETSPRIVADFNQNGYNTWEEYQAKQKLRFRTAYRDAFMEFPELKEAQFGWYGVDGGPVDRFEWKESRYIQRPINGQYYSTPDFYPRWPGNWRKWKGAWRGWEWIDICRKVEIPLGDKLYAPFIGAGWATDPTENVRPSQWLGLLKNLGATGAEFFYTFHYNAKADPADYIWQVALPAYAQAVTSHYEDILRNGDLLTDEAGLPITNHPVGDPRIIFTVRKHQDAKQYIIAASIQPNSNHPGNVPDVTSVKWSWDGMDIVVHVRRQGSVYLLNLEDDQHPIFFQLDAWHQLGHPSRWDSTSEYEAELGRRDSQLQLITSTPEGSSRGDFRDFTTYVSGKSDEEGKLCWDFTPRNQTPNQYQVQILARNLGKFKKKCAVALDDETIGKIMIPAGKGWQWYSLELDNPNALKLTAGKYELELSGISEQIQIDKIKITE
ncbi:hypothetical protein [Pontibacter sp. G13]|uniref:hypothetical protein n=1 Tax=Pontibacter sp. G13 TaxID=3074898 RepID=UPI00288A5A3E|nr:hypothetical protein [Pontibacter sp. G13]WNJ16406.1 hypothetical protein RJD25_16195 [Pontibacter sp. G13]